MLNKDQVRCNGESEHTKCARRDNCARYTQPGANHKLRCAMLCDKRYLLFVPVKTCCECVFLIRDCFYHETECDAEHTICDKFKAIYPKKEMR